MEHLQPHGLRRFRATGRERLEQLAGFLERLPPEALTFSRWYGQGKGCAVGLAAATQPWFQAQGLALHHDESLKECQPVYGDSRDWRAVSAFFEVSHADARSLFSQEGYDGELRPRPGDVAARIRAHLARRTPRSRQAAA